MQTTAEILNNEINFHLQNARAYQRAAEDEEAAVRDLQARAEAMVKLIKESLNGKEETK